MDHLMDQERAAAQARKQPIRFTSTSDVYNGLQRQPGEGAARMILFDARYSIPHARTERMRGSFGDRPWSQARKGLIRGANVVAAHQGRVCVRDEDGAPSDFELAGNVIAIVYDETSSKEGGVSESLEECIHALRSSGAQKVFA